MSDGEFKMVDGPHQPVEDQLAIHLLLNQYCHVVDRGTVDEIAALFSEDGILRPLHEGPEIFEGRDAVRAWYEDYDKRVRAGRRHRRHRGLRAQHISRAESLRHRFLRCLLRLQFLLRLQISRCAHFMVCQISPPKRSDSALSDECFIN